MREREGEREMREREREREREEREERERRERREREREREGDEEGEGGAANTASALDSTHRGLASPSKRLGSDERVVAARATIDGRVVPDVVLQRGQWAGGRGGGLSGLDRGLGAMYGIPTLDGPLDTLPAELREA